MVFRGGRSQQKYKPRGKTCPAEYPQKGDHSELMCVERFAINGTFGGYHVLRLRSSISKTLWKGRGKGKPPKTARRT